MDQDRKRQIRLVVALSTAVLLAVALIYTSFTAASDARKPSEVLAAGPSDQSYQLEGDVVSTGEKKNGVLRFEIADVDSTEPSMPVRYTGDVPSPYKVGREVLVTGKLGDDGVFMADDGSLITKCPSKFADEAEDDPNIIIEQ